MVYPNTNRKYRTPLSVNSVERVQSKQTTGKSQPCNLQHPRPLTNPTTSINTHDDAFPSWGAPKNMCSESHTLIWHTLWQYIQREGNILHAASAQNNNNTQSRINVEHSTCSLRELCGPWCVMFDKAVGSIVWFDTRDIYGYDIEHVHKLDRCTAT